jgi:ParB-like chromosome segregation protein Spo0J
MDQTMVDRLKASIEEDGFWGGIICRKLPNGTIQIGAGHHRVAAAIEAGYTVADVMVSDDLDDKGMIRVYARENATQRGNTGTAMAGMVASAIRHISKKLFLNQPVRFPDNYRESIDLNRVRGHVLGKYGMGQEIILAFLYDIPGVTEAMLVNQVALLKESGHYDRIIQEVQEEITCEHQEAIARAEKAKRQREEAEAREREAEAKRTAADAEAEAAHEEADRLRAEEAAQLAQSEAELAEKRRQEAEAEAAKFDAMREQAAQAVTDATTAASHTREKEFNYDGVNRVFTNTHQLRVFRELVTSDQFKEFIPYDQQPLIARQIQARAEEREEELSGAFIRSNLTSLLLENHDIYATAPGQRQRLHQEDWEWQWHETISEFSRHMRGLTVAGERLSRLQRYRRIPRSYVTEEFHRDLYQALEVLKSLHERLQRDHEPSTERTAHVSLPAPS